MPAFEPARLEDVPAIVAMYADDDLGKGREDLTEAALPRYQAAFARIEADPNSTLFVLREAGIVIASYLITIAPALQERGIVRAIVESVRVHPDHRSRGLGALMMAHAESEAQLRGATVVMLTSNKLRNDAHRFYSRLGYVASHEGFKKKLPVS
jgi:GNAT superfamily N-acetyltransferase